MKRAIPLLILAGVGGAGAYAIWRANEPDRRFGRIDDLLRAYQDKPHGAWTAEDTDELWRQVTWFNRGGPSRWGRRRPLARLLPVPGTWFPVPGYWFSCSALQRAQRDA